MQTPGRLRRPASVTLLAFGVLTVASLNLIRCIEAVSQWEFLAGILVVSPLYLALSGLFWAVAGLLLAWGLWRGLGWARPATIAFAVTHALYYWVDRLWVSTGYLAANWPFAVGMTALLLLSVFGILFLRKGRDFFTR